MIVTVSRVGGGRDVVAQARYTVAFDALPGRVSGPWGFRETCRDLAVSALLAPVQARALVLDAWSRGSASREAGGPGFGEAAHDVIGRL